MTGRTYGRVVWEDRWLAGVYWLAVAETLLALGASGTTGPFFEPGTVVSAVVGLLGLFIAIWLANRERNKRITENHFYKVQILWHVWRMLGTVESHYTLWDTNDSLERFGKLAKPREEMGRDLREMSISEYDYHKSQIETLNANTYVPADVRHNVLMLVRTGRMPIWWYHPHAQPGSNAYLAEKDLLDPLGVLIDSEYFTGDRSSDIREWLVSVNSIRRRIAERVDTW